MSPRKVTLVNQPMGEFQNLTKGKRSIPTESPTIKRHRDFINSSIETGLSIHLESEHSNDPNKFFKHIYRNWIDEDDLIYIEKDNNINISFNDMSKNLLIPGDHILFITEMNMRTPVATCLNHGCHQDNTGNNSPSFEENLGIRQTDHPIIFSDINAPGYGVDPLTKTHYLKFNVGNDLAIRSLNVKFKCVSGIDSQWALVVQDWHGHYGGFVPIKVVKNLSKLATLNVIKTIGEHHENVNNDMAQLADAHGESARNPFAHLDAVIRKLYTSNIHTAEGRRQLYDYVKYEKKRFYKISKRIRTQYHLTLVLVKYLESYAIKN